MKRIFIDDSKCLSCHSCELACAVAHSAAKNLYGALAEEVLPLAKVHVEKSGRGAFPLQCRHCQQPQCVSVCVTKSLFKDPETFAVRHDESRCIGCFMCAIACPFGAIEETSAKGKSAVSKCDLCSGIADGPACAKACHTKALHFLDTDAFSKEKRKEYLAELKFSSESLIDGEA